jgi:enamine deaminase RidA (YjgF/YER057c/UK114 family)
MERDKLNRTVLNPSGVATPGSHYSHSVSLDVGEATLIYLSGQVAKGPDGAPVGVGDLGQQAEQIFKNISAILEAHGATFEDVVQVRTFLVDGQERAPFAAVRERYLPSPPPVSTLVYVPRLVADHWLAEVEVTAATSRASRT